MYGSRLSAYTIVHDSGLERNVLATEDYKRLGQGYVRQMGAAGLKTAHEHVVYKNCGGMEPHIFV